MVATIDQILMKFEIFAFSCVAHLHAKFSNKSVLIVLQPLDDLTWNDQEWLLQNLMKHM